MSKLDALIGVIPALHEAMRKGHASPQFFTHLLEHWFTAPEKRDERWVDPEQIHRFIGAAMEFVEKEEQLDFLRVLQEEGTAFALEPSSYHH